MTYNPAPIPPDGSVTTAKLGGDVTTVGKAILSAADEKAQREALELDESATNATGVRL
jgi:hypothetical protein